MLTNKRIAVVVPAYNEEQLIGVVIRTMPDFVDCVYVVDDASTDNTPSVVKQFLKQKSKLTLRLIEFESNSGVGAAIVRGYREAVQDGFDVIAVMAGDAQMHPEDLRAVIDPIIAGQADYVKGNRLFTGEAWEIIPRHRYLGNAFLSLLTKVVSGYWHLADSQTGYTAISAETAKLLPLEKLYQRYGYPNHILTMLNVYNCRVRDVPVRPVYNIGERSGIIIWKIIPSLSWLLFKIFVWRMWEKYVIRDFHPLVFFYTFSFVLLAASIPLLGRLVWRWIETGGIPPINTLAFMFTAIAGVQSLFFAMWFDMDYNKELR